MKRLGFLGVLALQAMGLIGLLTISANAQVNPCVTSCYNTYLSNYGACAWSCQFRPGANQCRTQCAIIGQVVFGSCVQYTCGLSGNGAPYRPVFAWEGNTNQRYRIGVPLDLQAGRSLNGTFLVGAGDVTGATFYAMDLDAIPPEGFPPDTPLTGMPWTLLGNGTYNAANSLWELTTVLPQSATGPGFSIRVDFEDSVYGTQLGADFVSLQQCPCPVGWSDTAPTGISGRYGQAVVYDEATSNLLMFGGYDGVNALAETWIWNGSAWSRVFPQHSPTARYGAAVVYDRSHARIFLHGGYNANVGYLNDTWSWDGNDWAPITATGPACAWTGMAYDPDVARTVLYGGAAAGGRSRDTWEFDGTNWTLVTSNSPPGYRSFHSMVYDEIAGRIHMFGGQLPGGVETNSNWAYKNGVWTDLGAGGPSPRRGQQMTYRPGCGTILLYGGEMDGTNYGDTWEYVGAWRQISPGGASPAARYLATLTCTPDDQVVLFGGINGSQYYSDTMIFGCQVNPADVQPGAVTRSTVGLETRPNPFNPRTTVSFDLPSAGHIVLTAYDTGGRRVATLADEDRVAGSYSVTWDGEDDRGVHLPSGLYLLRLEMPGSVTTRRVSLIR